MGPRNSVWFFCDILDKCEYTWTQSETSCHQAQLFLSLSFAGVYVPLWSQGRVLTSEINTRRIRVQLPPIPLSERVGCNWTCRNVQHKLANLSIFKRCCYGAEAAHHLLQVQPNAFSITWRQLLCSFQSCCSRCWNDIASLYCRTHFYHVYRRLPLHMVYESW